MKKEYYVLNCSGGGALMLEIFNIGEEAKLLNRIQELNPKVLDNHGNRESFSQFIDQGRRMIPPMNRLSIGGREILLATMNA